MFHNIVLSADDVNKWVGAFLFSRLQLLFCFVTNTNPSITVAAVRINNIRYTILSTHTTRGGF